MYLSRVLLTGEPLRNPYEIHRNLWSVFPEARNQARDFLFRVEQRSSRELQVLMQSMRQPVFDNSTVQVVASKYFELNLLQGSQLRFLLIGNPVKTIVDEQGRLDKKNELKKCRVPLIQEKDQVDWLKRKLNKAALMGEMEIEKQLPLHFCKAGKLGKIQPYLFKGLIKVEDSSALAALIEHGIGPGKVFGCGLLSLARA